MSQALGWRELHLGVTERRGLVRVISLAINTQGLLVLFCSVSLGDARVAGGGD